MKIVLLATYIFIGFMDLFSLYLVFFHIAIVKKYF